MKRFNITVNGKAYDVAVEEVSGGAASAAVPVQTAPHLQPLLLPQLPRTELP